MKRIVTRIINTVILVLLLASSVAWPEPVSAGVSEWSAETIPSTTNNMLAPGTDVRDFAVGNDYKTIYAVPGDSVAGPPFKMYKSVDAGTKWTTIVPSTGIRADLVAIAPYDNNFVVIANNSTPQVCFSVDGGVSWTTLGIPQAAAGAAAAVISDIAVATTSSGKHYIAVAGWEAGNTGNIWYFPYNDPLPVWQETNTIPGFLPQSEVVAIAFSPKFDEDLTLVAITANAGASVNLQMLDFSSLTWNADAGYPCPLVNAAGLTHVQSASLALAANYDGQDPNFRNLFVGLTLSGDAAAIASSGVYRFIDTTPAFIVPNKKIHSVAYNGTLLMAGAEDTTTVYRVATPLAFTWTVNPYPSTSSKSPGGEKEVLLAWAGSNLLAGTGGNESAFSISNNSGSTFTDLSLIDTVISNATDVAVTAKATKVYMATDDGADTSLWYQTSDVWTRVFSLKGSTGYIVRTERTTGAIVYLAKKGAKTIYYNISSGSVLWQPRDSSLNVQDMAVESATGVYVLDVLGKITKSTNAGLIWGTPIDTNLTTGNMLYCISTNKLLAGSNDGYIAYSINGTSTWTKINSIFSGTATQMQVVPDQNFATNKVIYAASQATGLDIKKWQIGTSTDWTDIFNGTVAGEITGLAVDSNTLYALELNAGQSKLWRYINPSSATATSTDWLSIGVTTASAADTPFVLDAQPQALKVSTNKLWAVKTNLTNKLFSFTDSVTNVAITLVAPLEGYVSTVNSINGHANDVSFTWNRPSVATEYQIVIARTSDFTFNTTTITVPSSASVVAVNIGPNQGVLSPNYINFQPGTKFYWKIRISKPGFSLFSATRSFTIEDLPVSPGYSVELSGPVNGAVLTTNSPSFSWQPVQNTVEYEFVLSENPDMSFPLMDARVNSTAFQVLRKLEAGKTYFWRVRATQPLMADWSAVGNFTVAAAVAPPENTPVLTPSYVITLPAPTQTEYIFPPTKNTPVQIVPGYLAYGIIIALALTGLVFYLLFKRTGVPARTKADFGPIRRREAVKQPFTAPGKSSAGATISVPPPVKQFSPQETPKAVWPSARNTPETEVSPQPVAEEATAAKTILAKSKDAATVIFAARSFMWLSAPGGNAAPETPDKEREELGKKIAAKIRDLAKKEPLYLRYPEDSAMLLRLWARYGSGDETEKYLEAALKSRPENAIRLVKCFLPQAAAANKPAIAAEFSVENYRALADVVDPDIVYAALNKSAKFKLKGAKDAVHIAPEDSGLVSSFMHLHLQEKNTG